MFSSNIPKTHKRLKTLFNQTKQDRVRIFEEILYFKATSYNTKTSKQFTYLLPIGFLQKKKCRIGGKRLKHEVRREWSLEENEDEGMLQEKQGEQEIVVVLPKKSETELTLSLIHI